MQGQTLSSRNYSHSPCRKIGFDGGGRRPERNGGELTGRFWGWRTSIPNSVPPPRKSKRPLKCLRNQSLESVTIKVANDLRSAPHPTSPPLSPFARHIYR